MEIPKIKTKLEIKNEASDTPELYIYGVIRQPCWWDDEDNIVSANSIRKKLEQLKGKDINIHINSPGGDVFESIAVCNLLKQHDGKINIYIDSLAGSGASVIATAGEKVLMFANSMQMIHKAWTIVLGNADELRKSADQLDKIDTAVKASYMNKFVGTEDELEKLLADETYLTAEECLAFGLCTEILQEAEPLPQASIKETLFTKYNKNRKTPDEAGNKTSALFNAFISKKWEGNNSGNEKS